MIRSIALALALATAAALAACGDNDKPAVHADATRAIPADATPIDAPCPACARDFTAYPVIAQLDGPSEIWVLSDIHGDYAALVTLLSGAGIIAGPPASPSAVEWAQGSAAFVIVGDLIDKGPDAPDVIALAMALQASARAAGGHVIVTAGNHEAEFLADPYDASATKTGSAEGLDPELVALGLEPAVVAAGGDTLGTFMLDLPIAARVDDWFFVHAGNTGGATLAALAASLESAIRADGFAADALIGSDSLLEARLADSGAQWWDATGDAAALLAQWTAALGAQHLVMGHQPGAVNFEGKGNGARARDQMYAAYGGELFLIDTGMSIGVDDTGGALLHVTGAGTGSEAWDEVLPTGKHESL